MARLLSIATAGVRAEQLADTDHLRFPRVDYIELQDRLDTVTLDYSSYATNFSGGLLRRLETWVRSDVYLATLGWIRGRHFPTVFTWSERAGIPFAAYKRLLGSNFRFINMFQSWSIRQELANTSLGLFAAMDDIIVHCTSMRENLAGLGVPEEKLHVIHYSIDQDFFSPLAEVSQQANLLFSIGEPRSRDYRSFFQAVRGLPVDVNVAASGHWYARERNNRLTSSIPENITVFKYLPQFELKNLYASAQFVVLPIQDLVFSAGATASLEAGSMARAVIAFRSRGITDYILDGETGILVEPGDMAGLRAAMEHLLANPSEARRLGQNARQRIVEELNLENYVGKIANVLMKDSPSSG